MAGPLHANAAISAVGSLLPFTKGSSSSPLLVEDNTGTGEGIDTTSNGNYGIVGRTYQASTSSAYSGGIAGVDETTGTARSYNSGVYGFSQNGYGVFGVTSFNGSSSKSNIPPSYGVVGGDSSTEPTDGTNQQAGVLGTSVYGFGTEGVSSQGVGVYGQTSATGGSNAVVGYDANTSGSSVNNGVYGLSASGTGVVGQSTMGSGVVGSTSTGYGAFFSSSGKGTALTVQNSGGGLVATATNGTKEIMSLDRSGNLILSGTLKQKGSPLVTRIASDGSIVSTHLSEISEATLEDVGEARLVRGTATVRLDPSFARTIDPAQRYLVFVTPEDSVAGQLCVVRREPGSFKVIESGGASNAAFAYRIVAHPLGENLARLQAGALLGASPPGPHIPNRTFVPIHAWVPRR